MDALKPPQTPDAEPPIESSLRLRIRSGRLARLEREDPAGELDRREPDELFDPISAEEAED